MHQLTLPQLALALRQRKFSSVELTVHYLNRIQQQRDLNCFIHVDEDYALKAARNADQRLQNGLAKPLTGIPLAHKDIFCTEHLPTTCGSKMLANFTAPYQASLVAQLAEEGAVLLGKTNMDEFAMGSSNENSYFGAVKNPWDPAYVPGGSSGGSAAAVAARLVPFATGSDTGGSIRQPAAFCGVSGIKPTYGLVSRFGMVAFASSLDQAGPIAKTVEELALVLQAMAGFDEKDSTSIAQTLPDYTKALNTNLKGLRIGLPSYCLQKDVTADIQQAITDASHILQQAGAKLIPLTFTTQSLWVPCYYVIACAEASSNLSRYDGIRFGYRSQQAKTAKELIRRSRSEGFGLEVKRRILTGTHVLSSGCFDAYYLQALKIRRLIQNELQACFKQVDLIIGPTTPTPAFKLGEKSSVVERYLTDVFTVLANLTGIPALAIPVGFSAGLPISMQLMANHFNETRLFSVGHYYQQQTNWHQASPTDGR